MDISLEDQVCFRYNLNKLISWINLYKLFSWINLYKLYRRYIAQITCGFYVVSQALELRRYFKSLGAEISDEKSPKGVEDDLHKIVGVCDACFKEANEADIEAILNSIVSIMVSVSIVVIQLVIMLLTYENYLCYY